MKKTISVIVGMSLAIVAMSTLMPSSITTGGVVSAISKPGSVVNLYFDVWGTVTQNFIPITAAIVLIWAIALTIVVAGRGDKDVFAESVAWSLGIIIGFMCFIIPGILIWAVMGYRKGAGNAALILLGPIGSAITSMGGFATQWTSGAPITSFGAGPDLKGVFSSVASSINRASGRALGLTVLALFTFLSIIGVMSLLLWQVPVWIHLVVYIFISIAFAFSIVSGLKAIGAKEPSAAWIVAGALLFVMILSMTDIAVSGLKWAGALAPIPAVQAGLTGTTEVGSTVLLTILGGPILYALFGELLSERGWSKRRMAIGIIALSVTLLLILAVVM